MTHNQQPKNYVTTTVGNNKAYLTSDNEDNDTNINKKLGKQFYFDEPQTDFEALNSKSKGHGFSKKRTNSLQK